MYLAMASLALACLGVGFIAGRYTAPDPLKVLAAEGAKRIAAPIVKAMDDNARCNAEIERLASEVNVCAEQLGVQIKSTERAKREADQHARDAFDMAEQMREVRDAMEPDYQAWAEQLLPSALKCVRAREDCASGSNPDSCRAVESDCADTDAGSVPVNQE